jgi:flagellar basal-body rod modification protein FlgD
MKNEAFVAQLAQFSQLEGITNMSTSLADVADVMRSDRIMAGANLVGKSVLAQTGRIATDGSTPSKIEVFLPYGAEQVDLGIYDADSGALMRSIVSGPQTSGLASFNWDGRIADGSAAPTGTTSFGVPQQLMGQHRNLFRVRLRKSRPYLGMRRQQI